MTMVSVSGVTEPENVLGHLIGYLGRQREAVSEVRLANDFLHAGGGAKALLSAAMFSKSEMREAPSNGTCPVVSR